MKSGGIISSNNNTISGLRTGGVGGGGGGIRRRSLNNGLTTIKKNRSNRSLRTSDILHASTTTFPANNTSEKQQRKKGVHAAVEDDHPYVAHDNSSKPLALLEGNEDVTSEERSDSTELATTRRYHHQQKDDDGVVVAPAGAYATTSGAATAATSPAVGREVGSGGGGAYDGVSTLTMELEDDAGVSGSSRRRTSNSSVVTMDQLSKTEPFLPSQQGRFRNNSANNNNGPATSMSPQEADLIHLNSGGTSTHRLKFADLKFHGRDKEIQLLRDCLLKSLASSPTTSSESEASSLLAGHHQLVLISGESGTGKTALARHAINNNNIMLGSEGICLWGKFDQTTKKRPSASSEPYGAFVGAFQQLVGNALLWKNSSSTSGGGQNQQQQQQQKRFQALQKDLVQELNDPSEQAILVQTFEDLQDLFASSPVSTTAKTSYQQQQHALILASSESQEKKKSRFHNAFRKFIRVISKHFRPLCLVLDDLQWTTLSSLALLEIILTDPKCSNVMIVGCYRSNEVDETHSFSKVVRDLRQKIIMNNNNNNHDHSEDNSSNNSSNKKNRPSYEIHDITIGNLDLDTTKAVLSDLLSMDEEDQLQELAQLCHDKTRNNAFFLLTFLRSLCDNHYLEFHFTTYAWRYDIEEIRVGTGSTDNVAEMVKQRMMLMLKQQDGISSSQHQLNTYALLVIKLAGCLGARFQYDILAVLYSSFSTTCSSILDGDGNCEKETATTATMSMAQPPPFRSVINTLITESIFQSEGIFLRWVHDSIQEAATMLVSGEERPTLEKQMGTILLETLDEDQLDSSIFVVTNLHNNGPTPTSMDDRILLAKLNHRAANHAAEMSAVENATIYANKGIDLLPQDNNNSSSDEDKWNDKDFADLTLGLFTTSCRAETCLGNHDYVMTLAGQILQRDDINALDKLPIVLSKACVLESQDGKFDEAMTLCSDYLKELGCRVPRSNFGVVSGTIGTLISIKTTTKKLTTGEFLSTLPLATDQKFIATMLVLDKLCGLSVLASSPSFPLIAHRMLKLTLQHGLCEASPPAFALVGMLMIAIYGDFQGGALYAKNANQLLARLPAHQQNNAKARTIFLSSFFLLSWTQPLNSIVKPLLVGYETGLESGDIESDVYSIGTYVTVAILAGRPLEGLLDDCRVYFGQMKNLGRDRMYVSSNLCWQAILNLMGLSEDHLTLTGEAMDQDEFLVETMNPGMESNLQVFYWIRAFLYAIFGNHGLGAAHAAEFAKLMLEKYPCYPPNCCLPYYMGISLLDNYKVTKKKSYLKLAKFLLTKLKNYVKQGNPNVQHYKMALEGEMSVALKGGNNKTRSSSGEAGGATSTFEKAIALATRGGFIHDSALMNERFGDFLMGTDDQRALHHLNVSYSLYMEWGARKKADMLREKHKESVHPHPNNVFAGYTVAPSTLSR